MAVLPSLIGSIAGAAQLDGYAGTIEGLAGGPPLAHWRLGEVGGAEMRDRKGARHGTYAGTIGYGAAGLPQDSSNGAINFAGTGTGEVPHDAGLALSAFSLSFWFRLPTLPSEGIVWHIFSKEQSGFTSGDFFVRVDGAGDLTINFQSVAPNTNHQINTEVEPNIVYHLCIRADNTGFDAFLNGKFLEKKTTFTGAWISNTNALQFGAAPFSVTPAEVVLDEVALYPRVLTVAEVVSLAQKNAPPVANHDMAAVPENATTSINVLDNDIYVGTPTPVIVTQPGGGDSVAVNGQLIDYTAGAVTQDTGRSFTYRITDPNGQSNTATVNVTVLDAGALVSGQANCFPASSPDEREVTSMAQLESEINTAPPGRHLLIAPGTYAGGSRTFSPQGTEANPIVIRPRDGRGTVTINDASWTLANGSQRSVICNLFFNNASIVANGSHQRITRCRYRQVSRTCIRVVNATDMRIDHCDFADWTSDTNFKAAVQAQSTAILNGTLKRLLIDYCYCHDIVPTVGANGQAPLELGKGSNWNSFPEIVVDHCLFTNIRIPVPPAAFREPEVVCVKTQGCIIRFCTFSDQCFGHIQTRSGGSWEIRSCWFDMNAGQNGALRTYHAHTAPGAFSPLIIGNRFIGENDIWCCGGDTQTDGPLGKFPSRNGRYIGNRFTSGHLRVGKFEADPAPFPAVDNNLWDNTRDAGGQAHEFIAGAHSGTTFIQDNEPYIPAVKLIPSDVGMAAPDPLCPSGPQS